MHTTQGGSICNFASITVEAVYKQRDFLIAPHPLCTRAVVCARPLGMWNEMATLTTYTTTNKSAPNLPGPCLIKFVFISFSRIRPLDEFFFVAQSFQILQNQYKFSMILFRIMENWRFDMNLLCLKWFCFIENLIEWQNSWKAYKKQTLHTLWKISTSQKRIPTST